MEEYVHGTQIAWNKATEQAKSLKSYLACHFMVPDTEMQQFLDKENRGIAQEQQKCPIPKSYLACLLLSLTQKC